MIDNDPEGSAADAVGAAGPVAASATCTSRGPGISAARNRALDEAADADLLVFIDDDELPSPTAGWPRCSAPGSAGAAPRSSDRCPRVRRTRSDPWVLGSRRLRPARRCPPAPARRRRRRATCCSTCARSARSGCASTSASGSPAARTRSSPASCVAPGRRDPLVRRGRGGRVRPRRPAHPQLGAAAQLPVREFAEPGGGAPGRRPPGPLARACCRPRQGGGPRLARPPLALARRRRPRRRRRPGRGRSPPSPATRARRGRLRLRPRGVRRGRPLRRRGGPAVPEAQHAVAR